MKHFFSGVITKHSQDKSEKIELFKNALNKLFNDDNDNNLERRLQESSSRVVLESRRHRPRELFSRVVVESHPRPRD